MISGYPIWVVLLIGAGVFCASFVDAIGGGGGISQQIEELDIHGNRHILSVIASR